MNPGRHGGAERSARPDRLQRAEGLRRPAVASVGAPSHPAWAPGRPDVTDLVADAALDPSIVGPSHATRPDTTRPDPVWRAREPEQVLLTGATGFLGAFLLAEVLRVHPGARVHCLVRADHQAHAAERLRRNLHRYRLWDEATWGRVSPLAGDLERPGLGLAGGVVERLSEELHLVLHSGARVHLVEPYSRMRAANVLGTREVLRLAAGRAVPVHLVSTNGVLFARADNPGVLPEDRRLTPSMLPTNGYVRSKWVAEELARQGCERGVPTAIYRPGWISGASDTGACGAHDAFWTFIRVCVELRAAPDGDGWEAWEDLVPVDYVAAAIVHLAHHREPDGSANSLTNPVPTPATAVLARLRAAGYPLASLPMDLWGQRVAAGVPAAAALFGDVSVLRDHCDVRVRYDDAGTRRGLAGSGIGCPAVGADLLDRCLRYLRDTGFLPAPTRTGGTW